MHHMHMLDPSNRPRSGFTLIEVLVVIGIIAVLAAVVLVAVNPARQFKLARDSQRMSNVNALLSAVGQNMSEHRGVFMCAGAAHDLPSSPAYVKSVSASSSTALDVAADIAQCLVPDYLASLPFDPSRTGAHFSSVADYDTGYQVYKDANGRVVASSSGELSPSISVTR